MSNIDAVGALEVDVYKTARRPQTFLYVPRDLQPDQYDELGRALNKPFF